MLESYNFITYRGNHKKKNFYINFSKNLHLKKKKLFTLLNFEKLCFMLVIKNSKNLQFKI